MGIPEKQILSSGNENMKEKLFSLREFLNETREAKRFLLEKEIDKPLDQADADQIVLLMDAIEKFDNLEKQISEEEMTPEKITEIQRQIEGDPGTGKSRGSQYK
jgi:hypothetical protein